MKSTFKSTIAIPIAVSMFLPIITSVNVQANPLKRHPMMASIGAGMVAHHMAKKSARHGHHGIMARHPKMTGMAAGMAMHHMMKKKRK